MITLLLALIFACSAFNVFFLIIIMYHVSNIEDTAHFFMTIKKLETKQKLNSFFGSRVMYSDTDSVRTKKEGKHDKN